MFSKLRKPTIILQLILINVLNVNFEKGYGNRQSWPLPQGLRVGAGGLWMARERISPAIRVISEDPAWLYHNEVLPERGKKVVRCQHDQIQGLKGPDQTQAPSRGKPSPDIFSARAEAALMTSLELPVHLLQTPGSQCRMWILIPAWKKQTDIVRQKAFLREHRRWFFSFTNHQR